MWFDELQPGTPWHVLWKGYIRCGDCSGIREKEGLCPSCGFPLPDLRPQLVQFSNGREVLVSAALMGAEGRYEDWVYLQMLEREWKRPISDSDRFLDIVEARRPAARAVIVLLFWSYFETRVERLLRDSARGIPGSVLEDLLRRYSSVGSRLDRLYRILFDATYWSDLEGLGFDAVSQLLQRVQERRNDFAHGHPEAIGDALVEGVVAGLKDEHEAWIAVFNKRATRPRSARSD